MNKASVSRFLMVVVLFLIAVMATIYLVIKPSLFMTNPYFNGAIASIWALGVGITCVSLMALWREEGVFYQKPHRFLKILRPIIALYERTPMANATMVEDALDRCYRDWNHDFLRYMAGSLIFLGLLGTLWGLSETIVAISEVIGHLPAQDAAEGFLETLKTQLQQPLAGMGVAFSSSLLGVAGTLTMGFFIVQLDRAKEDFFQKAEWWARSVFKSADWNHSHHFERESDMSLARWADGVERLGRLYTSADKRQQDLLDTLVRFGEKNHQMVEWMKHQSLAMSRLGEEQTHTRQVLERMAQKLQDVTIGGDEQIKSYLSQMTVTSKEILRHMADPSWVDALRAELSVHNRVQAQRSQGASSVLPEQRPDTSAKKTHPRSGV